VKPIREFVVILTKRSYGTKNKKSTFRAKDEMFLWNIETPKITRRIIREFVVIKIKKIIREFVADPNKTYHPLGD
jgi:hypothetical protein